MTPPLRVGLIGCGAVVQSSYTRVLPAVPGIRVIGATDLDLRAAALVARQLGATPMGLEALLEGADAVVVATPPSTHVDIVRRALERGLTVLCEKPFTRTGAEALNLMQVAEVTRSKLFVNHIRRSFPGVRSARDFVRTGSLGRLTRIDAAEGGRFGWSAATGYVSNDPAGGVLYDTGSHTLDTALFVAGLDTIPFEILSASASRDREEPSHDFEGAFTLHCNDREIFGTVRLSRRRMLANRIRLSFEGGMMDVPISPRRRFRVHAKEGSMALMAEYGPSSYDHYFLETFRQTIGTGANPDFGGNRFLGLASLLETLAQAKALQ